MPEETLTKRVIIPMTTAMVEAVHDYRFMHRLESRAEAIRRLIEIGLEASRERGG
jgi:hypothetical protein